jgi:hypothetical protein
MCRPHWLVAVLSAIVLLPGPSAAADRFDLIYTDRFDVTCTPAIYGFTLGPTSFALLVNTGVAPITADEISGATFVCTSSLPDFFRLYPMVASLPAYAPIAAPEAVGSVIPEWNGVLLDWLQPAEVLRNTQPTQVLAFTFLGVGEPYVGPVTFDVLMRLGGREARFQIQANVQQGISFSVAFPSAARVSSTGVVATESTTWGKLKALYR